MPRLRSLAPICLSSALLLVLLFGPCCKRTGPVTAGETMYVSAPQANLRDHVATVYNRVGTLNNGDRVEVLERQKRFVRVRTAQKVEGWVELRSLVSSDTYEQFQKLAKENHDTPAEAHGVTRVELNMHVAPGRETETLYQLPESAKVEMLKRATAERATPEEIAAFKAAALAKAAGEQAKPTANKKKPATTASTPQTQQPTPPAPTAPSATSSTTPPPANQAEAPPSAPQAGKAANAEPPEPKPMDDWWLVRDQKGRVGWVLARMVDLDIPLDVMQYAEGQRIQAAFVLNTVQDEEKGQVAQYLVLLNENRDGLPYDFNQVRVFTWNLKRHRYETAFRDHYIIGYFPVKVANEDFGKEGTMPVFVIRKQTESGSIAESKYRLIGNIVRPVPTPGEQPPKFARSPDMPEKKAKQTKAAAGSKHKH